MKTSMPLPGSLLAAALSLFAVTAPAQTQVTVPNIPSIINVTMPFSSGIMRYQQWYSAASLQAGIPEPMRIERLEFFAALAPTSQAAQIDCEILMGHGKFSGVVGTFDSNWDSPPVVVKPRANEPLNAVPSGAVCMNLPFATRFTWDRTRPLLLEVRVHGNSLQSAPFNYNFRGSTLSQGTTSRVYAGGSPGATSGTVQQGVGLMTRFSARPGAVLDYGTGCAGEGGFVPQGRVVNVPSPGLAWTHQLNNASSQAICFWTIGDTDTSSLQWDLGQILGYPAAGCLLRNNVVNAVAMTTVGGGPGAGLASYLVNLPGTANYVGVSLYTQWVVFDPLAPNGILSLSNGTWSIVAPVGG